MAVKRFINRTAELEFLEQAYRSEGFAFVPLYGRRRIGKTELVKEFIRHKPAIYYLADTLPEKSKKGLFAIRDRYLNFWFRFVLGNKNYIEIGRFEPRFERVRQQIKDYQGFLFEEVCRQYLLRQVAKYEFQIIGRWWEKEEEIDLVAVDEENNRFIFAECTYRNKAVGVDVLEDLNQKIEHVRWHKPYKVAKRIIFSRSGFSGKLRTLAQQEETLELVAFDEMFL